MEPSTTNVFNLHYFEGLNLDKFGDVLNITKEEAKKKLAYVMRKMQIDSSMDEESEDRLRELIIVYESPKIPEGFNDAVALAIKQEEDNYAAFIKNIREIKY